MHLIIFFFFQSRVLAYATINLYRNKLEYETNYMWKEENALIISILSRFFFFTFCTNQSVMRYVAFSNLKMY